MEMQYFKWYSSALDRDMECKIYGHAGRPVLYIPTQDKRFFEFEDVRMTDPTREETPTGVPAGMSSGCIISQTNLFPLCGIW